MYVDLCKYKRGNKTYKRVLLREGYREGGKVKHRTLANLSHCSDEEIEAIRIALKMKKNLVELKNLAKGSYWCGKHVGPVAVLYQIANHLAEKAGGKLGVRSSHLTFLVEGSHFFHFVGGK